jgi:hypothetical protein
MSRTLENGVLNVRRIDPGNVGDANSSPFQYFAFAGAREVDIAELSRLPDREFAEPVIVVGGGGLLGYSRNWDDQLRRALSLNPRCVIWGAGVNRTLRPVKARDYLAVAIERGRQWIDALAPTLRGRRESDRWLPDYVARFKLAGIRDDDAAPGVEWVPCPSCMRAEFDTTWNTERGLGVLQHQGVPIPVPGVPARDRIDNRRFPIEEVLRFIGSSEAILTSSYHGAYWSTLMNKPTLVYQPFSTKFSRLRHPVHVYSGDLTKDLAAAKRYPHALAECREANERFCAKVRALVCNG